MEPRFGLKSSASSLSWGIDPALTLELWRGFDAPEATVAAAIAIARRDVPILDPGRARPRLRSLATRRQKRIVACWDESLCDWPSAEAKSRRSRCFAVAHNLAH